MSGPAAPTTSERWLKLVLRIIGCNSLLALIFVAAPFSWFTTLHAQLGLGPLSDQPVVGYLARSTSFFYALLGGLFWVVSFDPARYRPVLVYLGLAVTVFGAVLRVVDWNAGLPPMWTLWEGPFVIALGLTLLLTIRGVPRTET
jgi:hypothetical protein